MLNTFIVKLTDKQLQILKTWVKDNGIIDISNSQALDDFIDYYLNFTYLNNQISGRKK